MENLKINTSSSLKVAPLAGLASAAINAVLYFIGDATGLTDKTVGMTGPDGSAQSIHRQSDSYLWNRDHCFVCSEFR